VFILKLLIPAYRWCWWYRWWFRNVALSYEVNPCLRRDQLDGVVEADEIYQTSGNKKVIKR
jgi:hypothetical protein